MALPFTDDSATKSSKFLVLPIHRTWDPHIQALLTKETRDSEFHLISCCNREIKSCERPSQAVAGQRLNFFAWRRSLASRVNVVHLEKESTCHGIHVSRQQLLYPIGFRAHLEVPFLHRFLHFHSKMESKAPTVGTTLPFVSHLSFLPCLLSYRCFLGTIPKKVIALESLSWRLFVGCQSENSSHRGWQGPGTVRLGLFSSTRAPQT